MAKFSIEMKRGANTQICTKEVFNQAIQDASVATNCEMYQQTHDDKYKRRLPGICFHAWFADNKRHEESAQPNGLFIFDIDKVRELLGIDARTLYVERIAPRIDSSPSLWHTSPHRATDSASWLLCAPAWTSHRARHGWDVSWVWPTTDA